MSDWFTDEDVERAKLAAVMRPPARSDDGHLDDSWDADVRAILASVDVERIREDAYESGYEAGIDHQLNMQDPE